MIGNLFQSHCQLDRLHKILLPISIDEVLIFPEQKVHFLQPQVLLVVLWVVSGKEFIAIGDPIHTELDDIEDLKYGLVLISRQSSIKILLLPL